jgi:hypothetical protein
LYTLNWVSTIHGEVQVQVLRRVKLNVGQITRPVLTLQEIEDQTQRGTVLFAVRWRSGGGPTLYAYRDIFGRVRYVCPTTGAAASDFVEFLTKLNNTWPSAKVSHLYHTSAVVQEAKVFEHLSRASAIASAIPRDWSPLSMLGVEVGLGVPAGGLPASGGPAATGSPAATPTLPRPPARTAPQTPAPQGNQDGVYPREFTIITRGNEKTVKVNRPVDRVEGRAGQSTEFRP